MVQKGLQVTYKQSSLKNPNRIRNHQNPTTSSRYPYHGESAETRPTSDLQATLNQLHSDQQPIHHTDPNNIFLSTYNNNNNTASAPQLRHLIKLKHHPHTPKINK